MAFFVQATYNEVVNNVYSAYYQDEEQQKIQAVLSYINRIPNYFTTGPIAFKHGGSTILRLNGFY